MKKLKEREDKTQYNQKQNNLIILFPLVLALIIVALTIIFKNYLIAVLGLASIALMVFLYFTNKSQAKLAIEKSHEIEFVDLINYFEMFLANNMNIYQAFRETIAYSSPWMSNKIERLLEEIDEDKTVKPFINFAKNFKNGVIENVMISIYQMVDDGHNDISLTQFNLMFEKFEENNRECIIRQAENKLNRLNTYPLIGSIIVTVILTISIISIVGEMINGI